MVTGSAIALLRHGLDPSEQSFLGRDLCKSIDGNACVVCSEGLAAQRNRVISWSIAGG